MLLCLDATMLPRTAQQQKPSTPCCNISLAMRIGLHHGEFGGGCACAQHPSAAWSSGMILASGARGPGFNSRSSPFVRKPKLLAAMVLAAIEAGSQDTQEYKSTDAVVSERPCLTRVRCQMLLAKNLPASTIKLLCQLRWKLKIQTNRISAESLLRRCIGNHA